MPTFDVFLRSNRTTKQVVEATTIQKDGELLIFYDGEDYRINVKAIFPTANIAGVKIVPAKKKGQIGGKARGKSLSPKRRGAIAQAAAKARWSKG